MRSILFHIGAFPVRSYGLMMMIGFLAAVYLAARRARKAGANEEMILNIGLLSLVFGILGARLFYVVHYWPLFANSSNRLFAVLNLTSGGLEFYGGFLLAVAAVLIYLRLKKLSIRWYMDILAPSIMVGLAFGRIGCFLNGCCWGATCHLPWAVRFPYGSLASIHQWADTHQLKVPAELIMVSESGTPVLIDSETLKMTDEQLQEKLKQVDPTSPKGRLYGRLAAHLKAHNVTLADLRATAARLDLRSLPVHPTQIYSSINALLIAWILSRYFWYRRRHGMVVGLLFVIYPISRFLLEMIRADNPHDSFGLTVSQFISVPTVIVAALYMLYLRRLPEVSPRAAAELKAAAARKKETQ